MDKLLKHKAFDRYWISYLSSHTDATNRLCHYLGTVLGIVGAIGYSVALVGHFVFQKNSPHATKPHLGLLCDFLILYLYLFKRGELDKQLSRVIGE